MSIAGEAFITLPPIVPCARVACDPTIAEASARAVNRARISALATMSPWVTSVPSRSPAPDTSSARRPSRRSIATIASGNGALP